MTLEHTESLEESNHFILQQRPARPREGKLLAHGHTAFWADPALEPQAVLWNHTLPSPTPELQKPTGAGATMSVSKNESGQAIEGHLCGRLP